MKTAKELQDAYGMTSAELSEIEKSAALYERGEWPCGKVARVGRPPLYDGEVMERVTVRIKRSSLRKIDAAARNAGESRSDFIRQAADEKLSALASV